jgi:hypothetical protein
VDNTELGNELTRGPKLHQKWYVFFAQERIQLRKMESDFRRLRLRKQEFYLNGHDEETRALKWQMPPQGRVLKGEVQQYVDTDPDVVEVALEVGVQQEKVQFLESVLKTLKDRTFALNGAVKWAAFTAGG